MISLFGQRMDDGFWNSPLGVVIFWGVTVFLAFLWASSDMIPSFLVVDAPLDFWDYAQLGLTLLAVAIVVIIGMMFTTMFHRY